MIYYKLNNTTWKSQASGVHTFEAEIDYKSYRGLTISKDSKLCFEPHFDKKFVNGHELWVTRAWLDDQANISTGDARDLWEKLTYAVAAKSLPYDSPLEHAALVADTGHTLMIEGPAWLELDLRATRDVTDGREHNQTILVPYPHSDYINTYASLPVTTIGTKSFFEIKPRSLRDEVVLNDDFRKRLGIEATAVVTGRRLQQGFKLASVSSSGARSSHVVPSSGVFHVDGLPTPSGRLFVDITNSKPIGALIVAGGFDATKFGGFKKHSTGFTMVPFTPIRVLKVSGTDPTKLEVEAHVAGATVVLKDFDSTDAALVTQQNPYQFADRPQHAGSGPEKEGWYLVSEGALLKHKVWSLVADDPKSPASLG